MKAAERWPGNDIPSFRNNKKDQEELNAFAKSLFTFPASEHVLSEALPEEHYNTWILMVRIVELVFGCCRNGWTAALLELLRQLIWRHNILTEEVEGLTNCTISLHNLTHLTNDIFRHSSPDNYWCFVFERAVQKYMKRSSNSKNLEFIFAEAECRSDVLKFCQSKSPETFLLVFRVRESSA